MIELINTRDIKVGMFIDLEYDSFVDPKATNPDYVKRPLAVSAVTKGRYTYRIAFECGEEIDVPIGHNFTTVKYRFGKMHVKYDCAGCKKVKMFGGFDHPTRYNGIAVCPDCDEQYCIDNKIDKSSGLS